MARALDRFTDPARAWFEAALGTPTPVQERGWTEVAGGAHTLMCAPTGSGKTLAAFLWCLDRIVREPVPAARERCRVLYVSPLKALTVDVERNLRAPLRGIAAAAQARGHAVPDLQAAIRSGDTPAAERREMERHPPDILITTPESLYLLLTSAARELLVPVRWVIIDEIHTMAGSKRGAHLALSLERLAARSRTDPQRIGLSATQRPLEEVARYLGGDGRDVHIVDAGTRKPLDLLVEVPVDDMADLERGAQEPRTGSAAAIGNHTAAPRRSIWPAIHPRLVELIREHRSTIIFVNSRRLAERLAAQLNEVAGEDLVRAHHGSIAKEQRRIVEDLLKAGDLPALVATSSLELGIDMGAVDLVIQVESPTTVSRGLQRIGRAGHSVGEPSKGRILPKWRGDLLECAALVPAMLAGEVEPTRIPRNPLDVLAQQIVAMCALDEWRVDDLAALVRRAAPFADLTTRAFEAVLDMLDGRYPSEEFSELRARLSWDRLAGTLRGRAGAQRLAVTSGGTIPDRGLYTVNLLGDGRRVGELDEEMVYETRPGEVFVLGATSWRVADITPQQVLVTPAPGEPGKIAFWHGDTLGRPVEVGRAIGRLVRALQPLDDAAAAQRLRVESRFDERAATNLLAYLRDEREHTGTLPDDRTVVVQRFRDQLGDWRVCVLTPLGARVHAPWAIAVQAHLRTVLGVDVQEIHSDDGFALRLPDIDTLPPVEELLLDPDDVGALVTAELHGSALFASRFRENAARALLLPRRRPGERTPLWKQRQRSADLLQVAGRYAEFPILVETYRECLAEVFDMEALTHLMRDIRSRAVRVVEVTTDRASPFAASLMFDYIAQYMYEGDQPLAERRAQALTLDRELLAELLGSDELRELLDPAVVTQTELELQRLDSTHPPRDMDEALDVLRALGDLTTEEAQARGIDAEWLAELDRRRRVLRVRVAGTPRWIATDDAASYRDALGAALPPGLPDALLDAGGPQSMGVLLRRYARTHVPFTAAEVAERLGMGLARTGAELSRLVGADRLLAGQFHPGRAGEREFCHPEVLRQLRRRSLAALRREIEPVPPEALVHFLPAWHGVGTSARGSERLLEIIAQLQGAPLAVSVLERDLLAVRMDGYQPRLLDELVAMGEVVWVGRGALGTGDGRVALYLRDAVRVHAPAPLDAPAGALHDHVRQRLQHRGACFFRDLLGAAPAGADDLLAALWELVWAGEVTNDAFAPLRLHRGARSRLSHPRHPGPPRSLGRWSSVAQLLEPSASATQTLHALAGTLLLRHGVLTREGVLAEGVSGGFSALYPVLRAMEESGRVRRGYFVDGLGGSQFALAGAVDRLRAGREATAAVLLLSAIDPANPFGVTVPWPEHQGRCARQAGAYVLLEGLELVAYLERGGRSLLARRERLAPEHVAALRAVASRLGRLEVHTVNGEPVAGSSHAGPLREGGFAPSPRGLVAYPDGRAALRNA